MMAGFGAALGIAVVATVLYFTQQRVNLIELAVALASLVGWTVALFWEIKSDALRQ